MSILDFTPRHWTFTCFPKELEDRSFGILLSVIRNRLSAGGELRPIRFTVSEALANPASRTRQLLVYDPDYLRYTYDDVMISSSSRPTPAGRGRR
jgi:hypothetical protein